MAGGESTLRLTNKFNLPEPFVAAVSSDSYERGDAEFTATELIKPSRILVYSKLYDASLEEDVSDRVWAFQGQTKHIVLERIAKTNPNRYLVEQRFDAIMPGTGAKISAQLDLFDFQDGTLYDWKETSVWKFMLGDTREWEEQANINLYILRMNNFIVHRLVNIAILKDWKARTARFGRDKEYPKCAVKLKELPVWSIGQAQSFINERIEKHRAEAKDPPVCTKKERWQRDATFAVMRHDRKRAVKLCDNRDMAEAVMMAEMKKAHPGDAKKYFIEERASEPVRCLDFCGVQPVCDFGRQAQLDFEKKMKKEETL